MSVMVIERFAPSPTGLLHLGHAFSAWCAWKAAREARGRFLIRMEDLDTARVRPDYTQAITEDLTWLGIDWDGDILHQSTRTMAYRIALSDLATRGLVYRCTCSRRDINDAIAAPQEGVPMGPDGPVYPGTCRHKDHPGDQPHAIRLNMRKALDALGGTDEISNLYFQEIGRGPEGQSGRMPLSADALISGAGDVVLSRRDGAVAYHLAVIVDDGFQGITHGTRGEDLFSATPVHRVLQALLGLPAPVYRHHRLIRDDRGRRLAKRDDARAIRSYREAGLSPGDVLRLTGISDP